MSGAITAILAVLFVFILAWRIKPAHFRELRWALAGTAAVFWSVLAVFLVSAFWDTYYQYFFPGWFRSGGLLLYVPLVYGALALALHWLALRMPGNPIAIFCLLSGAESLLEHIWGIYGFLILDVPALQEASPASILAFSFPEYILYWCVVVGIAAFVHGAWRWLREPGATGTRVA